jgi:uncharacterized protein (DUF1330 family)
MSALFIVNYQILNHEGYQLYVQSPGGDFTAQGGELLALDSATDSLEGNPGSFTATLRFPSKDAAREWYDSPGYQAKIRHRLDNTEGIGVLCKAFDPNG